MGKQALHIFCKVLKKRTTFIAKPYPILVVGEVREAEPNRNPPPVCLASWEDILGKLHLFNMGMMHFTTSQHIYFCSFHRALRKFI